MGKTPEEIKKGLNWCIRGDTCFGCPYESDCYDVFSNKPLSKDTLAYIQQLEADNSRKDDTIRSLTEQLNAAHEETVKAMRERDAAVADLASIPRCKVCANLEKDNYEEPCDSCAHIAFMGDIRGNWQWRGVCPENTEGSKDE